MTGCPHLTRENAFIAHLRRTRETHLAAQQRVFTDFRRVAHLNHVVEFRAAADLGFAYRGAIDCALGLDFDIVADDRDSALAHFVPGSVGLPREAEAVAADYDSVLKQDAMADAAVLTHGAVRVGEEILADFRAAIDRYKAVQHGVAPDLDVFIDEAVR